MPLAIDYLKDKIKDILRWKKEDDISVHLNFFELGMDSLMAVELRHSVQMDLVKVMNLTQTVVFEYPSVQLLAEHIVGNLTADTERASVIHSISEVDQLSEAELDALLRVNLVD